MGREDWGTGRASGLLLMPVGTGKRWHSLDHGGGWEMQHTAVWGVYFQSDQEDAATGYDA